MQRASVYGKWLALVERDTAVAINGRHQAFDPGRSVLKEGSTDMARQPGCLAIRRLPRASAPRASVCRRAEARGVGERDVEFAEQLDAPLVVPPVLVQVPGHERRVPEGGLRLLQAHGSGTGGLVRHRLHDGRQRGMRD